MHRARPSQNWNLYFLSLMKDRRLLDFVLHPIEKSQRRRRRRAAQVCNADQINTLKPTIFKLFRNLEQITILSSSQNFGFFPFILQSVLSTLSEVVLPPALKTLVIKDEHPRCSGAWLQRAVCKETERKFAAKGFYIELHMQKGSNSNEHWAMITV